MASIKEAYDSTIGESFTGLKLLLWAIPFGYCRKAMTSGSMDIISTIITLGYEETPTPTDKKRKNFDEVVYFERIGEVIP